MKVVSAAEMAALDQRAIREVGIPGVVLMETAGRALAYACARRWPRARGVLVFCGPGNNGGDGYVAARTLLGLGYPARCLSLGDPARLSGDAALHAGLFRALGGQILDLSSRQDLSSGLPPGDVIIDALFGTGLRRPLEGLAASLVEVLNASGLPVVAADVPSGICSDTGRILGTAVRAHLTVTMGLPKRGLFLHPGAARVGELQLAEIGLPPADLDSPGLPGRLLTAALVRSLLPLRPAIAHKGSCGAVLVVGGSRRYLGAPALAAEAALRVGSGLVELACPAEIRLPLAGLLREILTLPLPSPGGYLEPADLLQVLPLRPQVRALCLGPGLAGESASHEAIRQLLAKTTVPVVIDADALHSVAHRGPLRPGGVLTPHPGEMSSLVGVGVTALEADRVGWAQRCAAEYQAVVVFKGAPTVVAEPGGRYWINTSGGPVLAQGGTGDVLAGAVAGLLAQGLQPAEAACAAVHLHGLAGDLCAARSGSRGILAGEVAAALPKALQEVLDTDPGRPLDGRPRGDRVGEDSHP